MKMFKPNTMVFLIEDVKKNRAYMFDVTSKEIYAHHKNCSFVTKLWPLGALAAWFASRDLGIPSIYLSDLSFASKVLLAIVGIALGLLCIWITQKKTYTPQREEYFKRYPRTEKIDAVSEMLDDLFWRAVVSCVIFFVLLIASVYMFSRFLINSNLVTYFFSLGALLLFTMAVPGMIRFYRIKQLIKKPGERGDSGGN